MRKPCLTATVAAAALGLVLSSCAADDAEPAAADADESPSATTAPTSPSTSTSPSGSATTQSLEPSEPATTSSLSEEPSATMTPPSRGGVDVDVASMLLPADRMGKLNAEWTWSSGNDFDTEPANLAACHRVELEVIGAEDVAVREYTSRLDAGVRAYHLVAVFPDEMTARRAYSVLQSWRDGCRQRLEQRAKGRDGVKVSSPDPVSIPGGTGSSYVVFQPTATGSTRVENVGTALAGSVIDLVVVKLEGDDFNYPRGRTPAAVGVRNAAQRGG
jgi:hypothetical protein